MGASQSAGHDRGGTGAPQAKAHAAEIGKGQTEKGSDAVLHCPGSHRNSPQSNPTKKIERDEHLGPPLRSEEGLRLLAVNPACPSVTRRRCSLNDRFGASRRKKSRPSER